MMSALASHVAWRAPVDTWFAAVRTTVSASRRVMASTEDVGERFAEEARKMHYGESEERGIRGQATPAQTEELLDEGIAVMPLPIPAGFKNTLQ